MDQVALDMAENIPRQGQLAANILNFVRLLRGAGIAVGPAKVLDAVAAVARVGVARKDDFYWTLHAVLVPRYDQHEIFDQAFKIFWQNPDLEGPPQGQPSGTNNGADNGIEEALTPIARRLADALIDEGQPQSDDESDHEPDAAMTWSASAQLGQKDFEQMSTAEIEAAKRAIARMRLPVPELTTRRFRPGQAGGRIDIRRTLSRAVRDGADVIPLAFRRRRVTRPPLVVLCDISGSMSRYSRMFLHFLHALGHAHETCHVFVFGTELTNITRHLVARDIDDALAHIGGAVDDWSGGTRIGTSLHQFNRDWGRRVLGQSASVLMITDGLDRAGADGVSKEIVRLRRSCRRLIWLNPLMRFDGYAPLALGAAAMAPHVDDMRTIHNLDSMEALAQALSAPTARIPKTTRKYAA